MTHLGRARAGEVEEDERDAEDLERVGEVAIAHNEGRYSARG